MRGKCIANHGSALMAKRLEAGGASGRMSYPLVLEKKYDFFGVLIDRFGMAKYLVCDETSNPNWLPSEFFELLDGRVPSYWSLKFDPNQHASFRLGYDLIVNDSDHFEGLIEGNADELLKFFLLREEWKKSAQKYDGYGFE